MGHYATLFIAVRKRVGIPIKTSTFSPQIRDEDTYIATTFPNCRNTGKGEPNGNRSDTSGSYAISRKPAPIRSEARRQDRQQPQDRAAPANKIAMPGAQPAVPDAKKRDPGSETCLVCEHRPGPGTTLTKIAEKEYYLSLSL